MQPAAGPTTNNETRPSPEPGRGWERRSHRMTGRGTFLTDWLRTQDRWMKRT